MELSHIKGCFTFTGVPFASQPLWSPTWVKHKAQFCHRVTHQACHPSRKIPAITSFPSAYGPLCPSGICLSRSGGPGYSPIPGHFITVTHLSKQRRRFLPVWCWVQSFRFLPISRSYVSYPFLQRFICAPRTYLTPLYLHSYFLSPLLFSL